MLGTLCNHICPCEHVVISSLLVGNIALAKQQGPGIHACYFPLAMYYIISVTNDRLVCYKPLHL